MLPSLRTYLACLAALAIPLGVFAGASGAIALRQIDRDRETAVAQMLGVLRGLVSDTQSALRREAAVLARDPVLVESAARGDWAMLARSGAPRIVALTRDGIADLVALRDARGAPLVQVPPVAAETQAQLPAAAVEPRMSLAVVDGRPYFFAAASLAGPWVLDPAAGRSIGTVVLGRRVEGVERALEAIPSRPGVVFLTGERALGAARFATPAGGWSRSAAAGRAVIGPEVFAMRPLIAAGPAPSDGGLWALVPETEWIAAARRLWAWLAALFAGGAAILALGLGVILSRAGRTSDANEGAGARRDGEAPKGVDATASVADHLQETRALLEVDGVLNSTLDPRRLLERVAIVIAQVCQVDRCSIERWDGDRVVPLMSQFADGHRDERLWNAFIGTPAPAPRAVPAHAQAIESRRPVVIADATATDQIPREWIETYGHKSFMAVPLIHQAVVIGVMTLDYTERVTPFEPWQVSRATAIAARLALSIENARLYAEAQERLRETTTLLAVGQALSQPGPPDEAMRRAAREVGRAFGADMVGVYVLNAAKDALVPVAGYHVPKHLVGVFLGRPFVRSRFAVTAAWERGEVVCSSNVAADPRFDAAVFEGMGPMSLLFVPTRMRGESVGGLFLVWWAAGREFTDAEVRLVGGVAAQLGLAMENAELARQTQAKLEETERLLAVSRTLASTLDLETLPRALLRHVVHALGADSGGIWLLDERGEWMEPLVGYHVPPARVDAFRRLRLSIVRHPFYAEAARTRRPVVSVDVMRDERIPSEVSAAVPRRTHIFVPIIAEDRMLGGIGVTWWETARELTAGELGLMETIASQAGVAIDKARLFRDNQHRVEELSVLHELSRAVTGQLDQAELLDTIHHRLARLLDARQFAIVIHDEERDELEVMLRVKDGLRSERHPRRYPRHAADLSGVVLDTGRPIRTDDYHGECVRRAVVAVPGSEELPHWLGVPMAAGNRRLGVLALRSRDRAFTEHDERLLVAFADLAALALRSARLYQERTRAHAELGAAQDQLVRTEKLRALGEMASGVAHDFNNVLAAIVGRAQLLRWRIEDPVLRQWLEVIERAAMDGARTVKRLQDFTRIRRDQPVVPVDLNRVIEDTLEATEPSWRQETRSRGVDISVETALSRPLPHVSGDPAELREAMTNLVLNALDAMPGGGKLRLSTAVVAGSVEVTVGDTGLGIPEGIRGRIFDPFFTTKGPKGTGLGLSMTYGILARHDGEISVESEEGRGTTFRLSFPAIAHVPEPPPPAVAPPATRSPLRCLVVDDEEMVARALGDILAAMGHDATVAASGEDALERLRAAPFDLVLTDLAMPGMTGWDVARAVKERAPHVPVVLVSGFGVELSPEDLRANDVDLILAKPLKIEDIEAGVRLCNPDNLAAEAGSDGRRTEGPDCGS